MGYKRPERRHYYDRKVGGTVYEIIGQKFHRKVQTLNGVKGTLLPYTTGEFYRPGETGPRGGKAYLKCWRQTWWADGRVCAVKNVCVQEATDTTGPVYERRFVPVTGKVWNRYDHDEEQYSLVDGVLLSKIEDDFYSGACERREPEKPTPRPIRECGGEWDGHVMIWKLGDDLYQFQKDDGITGPLYFSTLDAARRYAGMLRNDVA